MVDMQHATSQSPPPQPSRQKHLVCPWVGAACDGDSNAATSAGGMHRHFSYLLLEEQARVGSLLGLRDDARQQARKDYSQVRCLLLQTVAGQP